MIATIDEIKALLAITVNTQDELIKRLMPIVEDEIRNYCNNDFRNRNVYVLSGDISFTHNSTSADTINLDIGANQDGFVEAQFKAGQTVQVLGSYNNDKIFEIDAVSSTALTLYMPSEIPYVNEVITEDESVLIKIDQINYPESLKNIQAQMIRYKLSNYDYQVKAETVSRYSVTYNDDLSGGYPRTMMTALNKFRRPVLV